MNKLAYKTRLVITTSLGLTFVMLVTFGLAYALDVATEGQVLSSYPFNMER